MVLLNYKSRQLYGRNLGGKPVTVYSLSAQYLLYFGSCLQSLNAYK